MSSDSRNAIGRREFLYVSSALALATGTLGPRLFAQEAPAPKRLALGYAGFEENAKARDAGSIPAGDGAFIGRGARISLSGISGIAPETRNRHTVDLLVHYSYWDGAERRAAPFRAWACSRSTGCEGNPVRFNVPVDEQQKIVFTIETERGIAGGGTSRRDAMSGAVPESRALPVTLTLASGEGTKLVRGFYIIVPLFENDSEPAWSSYEVKQPEDRWVLVDRDGKAASFEHFVLRIDYAS